MRRGARDATPPTRRGFPPSVFAMLPKLMERVGMNDKGSITALYTVLVEGDDMTEPIADETRSILDGHIILSRKLGAANHYPAIDVLASASRVMGAVTTKEHRAAAGRVRTLVIRPSRRYTLPYGVDGDEYLRTPQLSEPGTVRAGAAAGAKSLLSRSPNAVPSRVGRQ